MKEWIVIEHSDPHGYQKDLELFKEAIAFVRSKSEQNTVDDRRTAEPDR